MKAIGTIDHNKNNLYKKKTVLINNETYFITNDSMPETIMCGMFDYNPDEAFALFMPDDIS